MTTATAPTRRPAARGRLREGSCQLGSCVRFERCWWRPACVRRIWRLLRRRILTWGATEAEAGARLAGDDLLEDPDGVSTRAVWIDAPAAVVWPWRRRWAPTRAAAPTPTTGSRTSSAWACTASIA